MRCCVCGKKLKRAKAMSCADCSYARTYADYVISYAETTARITREDWGEDASFLQNTNPNFAPATPGYPHHFTPYKRKVAT